MNDFAAFQIDTDLVALIDRGIKLGTFDDGKAVVDGVAIKRPGERARHHRFDAQTLNCRRGLLTSAAAAEIAARHNDLEIPQLGRESVAQHLKGMLGQFFAIDIDQIAAWNNNIGINVISEFKNAPFDFTHTLADPQSRLGWPRPPASRDSKDKSATSRFPSALESCDWPSTGTLRRRPASPHRRRRRHSRGWSPALPPR